MFQHWLIEQWFEHAFLPAEPYISIGGFQHGPSGHRGQLGGQRALRILRGGGGEKAPLKLWGGEGTPEITGGWGGGRKWDSRTVWLFSVSVSLQVQKTNLKVYFDDFLFQFFWMRNKMRWPNVINCHRNLFWIAFLDSVVYRWAQDVYPGSWILYPVSRGQKAPNPRSVSVSFEHWIGKFLADLGKSRAEYLEARMACLQIRMADLKQSWWRNWEPLWQIWNSNWHNNLAVHKTNDNRVSLFKKNESLVWCGKVYWRTFKLRKRS